MTERHGQKPVSRFLVSRQGYTPVQVSPGFQEVTGGESNQNTENGLGIVGSRCVGKVGASALSFQFLSSFECKYPVDCRRAVCADTIRSNAGGGVYIFN